MNINSNSKKEFISHISRFTRQERSQVITELLLACAGPLDREVVPANLKQEITYVRSRFLKKNRLQNHDVWKLWVFAMKPSEDLRNWVMTRHQCYRLKPQTKRSNRHYDYHARPRTDQKRARRPSIRDCNGMAVPRRWLDRFAPHIKTQEDWDNSSIYRNSR